MINKKKIFLSIAILIPVLFVAGGLFFIVPHKQPLLASLKIENIQQPQNNFLYTVLKVENLSSCTRQLKSTIFPNKNKNEIKKPISPLCGSINLFVYNFFKDSNEQIDIEQAKKLVYLPATQLQSPDGFMVASECTEGAVLQWTGDVYSYNDVCITKGDYQRKLNIQYPSSNGENAFVFLGWIKENNQV